MLNEALAERVGLDATALDALRAFADSPTHRATLEPLRARWLAADAADAMAAVREASFGDDAMLAHLTLALWLVPQTLARHAERGVDAAVSTATLRDLSLWNRHFRKLAGREGITLEVLDWSQHYLRGELYRIGALQWDLCGFSGPLVALRHRASRELVLLAVPGVAFAHEGRTVVAREQPGAFVAGGALDGSTLTGHPIDPHTGAVQRATVALDRDDYEVATEPGTPMLEMHIPADARVSMRELVRSTREAFAFFARIEPTKRPLGIQGEAWLLDPQLPALMPRHPGIAAMQQACHLYPSRIPEAKTLRRFFGPLATRADVLARPRDGMNSLQRALAAFLEAPERSLCAAGGLILNDRLEPLFGMY